MINICTYFPGLNEEGCKGSSVYRCGRRAEEANGIGWCSGADTSGQQFPAPGLEGPQSPRLGRGDGAGAMAGQTLSLGPAEAWRALGEGVNALSCLLPAPTLPPPHHVHTSSSNKDLDDATHGRRCPGAPTEGRELSGEEDGESTTTGPESDLLSDETNSVMSERKQEEQPGCRVHSFAGGKHGREAPCGFTQRAG